MTANELLALVTELFFIALGLITVVDFLRHRDTTRRDIAVTFSVLALPFLARLYENSVGQRPVLLDQISLIALLSQPYLSLRLANYYYRVPAHLQRFALLGMFTAWVLIIILPAFMPPLSLVFFGLLALYFTSVNLYAMTTYVRGALSTSGVVRQRLRFAAAASGLLVLALLVLSTTSIVKAIAFITPFAVACGIVSALCFYLGFAPPRWLRRAWQYTELRSFLSQRSMMSTGQRLNVTQALNELCVGANQAVGGVVSAVIQRDETSKTWSFRFVSKNPELSNQPCPAGSMIDQAWASERPLAFRLTSGTDAQDRRLMELFEATTVIIAPIATDYNHWGLLLVFPRHNPLFIQDDLAMVILLARQSAVFLENGTLVEALYSDSARLEREIEESRIGYKRIVETAQEGIWETDKDFNTVFVNARMAEMLGYTVEEIMATPAKTFIAETSRQSVSELQQRRSRGVREQFELPFRRKDGSEIITLVSSAPYLDEHGEYQGALAMLADITERKHADEQVRRLNTELEERVAARTAQLTAVNRELEAFSYSVSHDLRAPLRALDGFSQILIEDYTDRLDEEGLKYLHRIRAGSQRMGQLIDSLLQLSRLTRMEMQHERINLSEIAKSIRTDLMEQHPERKVDFRIEDNLTVSGDERLLRAAVTNLLNNAWKFTGRRSNPCIEFGRTQQSGETVYFVRDNGVGFDMTYANKLFGAFQRLHGFDEFEGTGIGLATVERIIHRHRGRIWADAAVDQGATFYFTVPV